MKFQRTTVILLLAMFTIISIWNDAGAWSSTYKWGANNATYYYASTLPTRYNSGTDFGANQWTNVTSSSWTWNKSANSGNLVSEKSIDGAGKTLAVTSTFIDPNTNRIFGMKIEIDKAEEWYTGSSTPSYVWQYDFRSAMTHEFGHALGLNHTQTSRCGSSSEPTMCAGLLSGTTYRRSLETDDKNGVSSLYP